MATDRHLVRGLHAPPSIFSGNRLLRKGVTSALPYAQVYTYLKKIMAYKRSVSLLVTGSPEPQTATRRYSRLFLQKGLSNGHPLNHATSRHVMTRVRDCAALYIDFVASFPTWRLEAG